MKKQYQCDWCGKPFERYESQTVGKKYVFCSRQCLWSFSSKELNPEKYVCLKDLSAVSQHLSELNSQLNPTRMTAEVRAKIRHSRLGKGNGISYGKLYGRHEHRVVAEKILGRPLKADEVVHHMDFNKRNNAAWNNMIFSSQSDHAKYHAQLNAFFQKGVIPTEIVPEVMPYEVRAT